MTLPRRKHVRLRNYDYREAGAYFITVCVAGHMPVLSVLHNDAVRLLPAGEIVNAAWIDTPHHHPHVTLDAFVVMPDHVHGILFFGPEFAEVIDREADLRAQHAAPLRMRAGSLGAVVRGFKSASTREINRAARTPGAPFWQRGYWDRVIRNEDELRQAREYIDENPLRWWEKYGPGIQS
jgi:putative transposase